MTNHTPAPWMIDDNGDISGCSQCDWVATSSDGITFKSDTDCNLILAAPDMYEALEEVKNFMDTLGIWAPKTYERVCDALKKARGEV